MVDDHKNSIVPGLVNSLLEINQSQSSAGESRTNRFHAPKIGRVGKKSIDRVSVYNQHQNAQERKSKEVS